MVQFCANGDMVEKDMRRAAQLYISMIPTGTLRHEPDNPDFRQNPWIIFSGKVIHTALRCCCDADPDDCNYALFVTVETLDMPVTFELDSNADVEVGEYWYGKAFLSAVIQRGDQQWGAHKALITGKNEKKEKLKCVQNV